MTSMLRPMLQIVAGPEARRQILANGFEPKLFDKLIGASGGPKWLPLAKLDRHLMYQFLRPEQELSLLGTSSGGWRCAMLCSDNDMAHQKLQEGYTEQWYDKPPPPSYVDKVCRDLLEAALAQTNADQLCANPKRRLNIITNRARHLNASSARLAQVLGLIVTAGANVLSRKTLDASWQRWLFHSDTISVFGGMTDLPTHCAKLTPDNLLSVLLATGSIPLALSGVEGIIGVTKGRHFDGGVTDYHLDLPALRQGGLTLYPHFYPYALPGWFDKKLAWRRANDNLDKVVILAPTDAFISSLPGSKLPDRTDFKRYPNAKRIELWYQAAELGQQLVEDFERMRQDPAAFLHLD